MSTSFTYSEYNYEEYRKRKTNVTRKVMNMMSSDWEWFRGMTARTSYRKTKKKVDSTLGNLNDTISVKGLGEYRIQLDGYRFVKNKSDDTMRFTTICRWAICRTTKKGKKLNNIVFWNASRVYSDDALETVENVLEDMFDVLYHVITEDAQSK